MPPRFLPCLLLVSAVLARQAAADGTPLYLPITVPVQAPPVLPPPTPLPERSPEEPRGQPPEQPPAPEAPSCVPTKERTFKEMNVHLVEQQDLKMIPNVALHQVITRVPSMDVQVDYKEEKRTVQVLVLKTREVDQLVTSMTLVPETTVDCNGCPHTEYKQVPICKTVKMQVFEQVPENRTYTIKVPVIKPVEKETLYRSYVLDCTPQPAAFRRYGLIVMPTEACVQVPTCPVPGPLTPPADAGPQQPEPPPRPLPPGTISLPPGP